MTLVNIHKNIPFFTIERRWHRLKKTLKMRPFEICNRITVAIIYSVLQIGSTSFIDVNHPIVISDGTIASQTSNFGYAISGFSSSASKRHDDFTYNSDNGTF